MILFRWLLSNVQQVAMPPEGWKRRVIAAASHTLTAPSQHCYVIGGLEGAVALHLSNPAAKTAELARWGY